MVITSVTKDFLLNFNKINMKVITYIVILECFLSSTTSGFGGGSSSTLSVTYGSSPIICGIVAYEANHHVRCWKEGVTIHIFTNVSFEGVTGGFEGFCGLSYGGSSVFCWNSTFSPERIYEDKHKGIVIKQLSFENTQICSITNNNSLWCWRDKKFIDRANDFKFVSSGTEYSCGIHLRNSTVSCFGTNKAEAMSIEDKLSIFRFVSIDVGGHHVCGFDVHGIVVCQGNNEHGQSNVPDSTPHAYSSLALEMNHTCGIWSSNKSVICWGGEGGSMLNASINISLLSFETVVAGFDFTCGLLSLDSSVICWGVGWRYPTSPNFSLPLLPGPCVSYGCDCGIHPQSQKLCFNHGSVCTRCNKQPITSHVTHNRDALKIFLLVVGSAGFLNGIIALVLFTWTRFALCIPQHVTKNNPVYTPPIVTNNNTDDTHTHGSISLDDMEQGR